MTRIRGVLAAVIAAVALSVGILVSGAAPAHAAPAGPAAPTQACTPGDTKISGLIPDGCYGDYPVSSYDISYSVGISPSSWGRNIMGFLTKLSYNIGTWFVSLAQWSVEWAFEFPIGEYGIAALELSNLYETRILGGALGVNLFTLAYVVLFAYVGANVLRNKAGMALGELAVSVVLITCGVFLVGNLNSYMTDAWRLVNSGTAALLVAANPDSSVDPATADEGDIDGAVREVQVRLHDLFIAEPYDLINWGEPLTGECARRRDDILRRETETRWHEDLLDQVDVIGVMDEPHEIMGGLGYRVGLSDCEGPADFNATPTGSRLGSAVLSMAASIIVGIVLTTMGLTVVIAKFVVLVLFGVAPFLVLFAILPGSGRRWGWMWLTTFVQAVVVAVGLAFVLSMVLTIMRILLDATAAGPDGTGGRPLVERFALVVGLVMLLSTMRNRLLSGTQNTAGRVTDNLTNARVGGGGLPWQGPTGTSGTNLGAAGTALNRAMMSTGATMAHAAVIGTAVGAGALISQRMRERRMWHNTVKARLLGDQISAVSDRGYIGTDPLGSASGVMVRGGFPPPASLPAGVGGSGVPAPGGGGGPLPGGGGGSGRPVPGGPQRSVPVARQNLWERSARAYEAGRVPEGLYYQKMAQLHHNYEHGAARKGAVDPKENYEIQARVVREEYTRSTNSERAPIVPRPWYVQGLGNPRPGASTPPIATPGKSRRFNEVVRHTPVYPKWAWRKRWLWGTLRRGNRVARDAARSAEGAARNRGYDL